MNPFRHPVPICLVLALTACASAPNPAPSLSTTVVILRHAEKAVGGDDPGLTDQGHRRAESIVDRFCRDGLRAAYASQYQRTQKTAEPCAAAAGQTVRVNTLSKDFEADAQTLRTEILAAPGGKVLVVGHSNTVPILIKALTGVAIAPIGEQEYDRWFEVTLDAEGRGVLSESRYGSSE